MNDIVLYNSNFAHPEQRGLRRPLGNTGCAGCDDAQRRTGDRAAECQRCQREHQAWMERL